MTAASVWAYSLCGLQSNDNRVAPGLQWLAANYNPNNMDASGPAFDFWYYYPLALSSILHEHPRLGGHDWFADISAALCQEQLCGWLMV